jgi:hypothetical protein
MPYSHKLFYLLLLERVQTPPCIFSTVRIDTNNLILHPLLTLIFGSFAGWTVP